MDANPDPRAGDDLAPGIAKAREQAIREILGAISSSRDDEGPVFDAILKNAALLCDAQRSFLFLADEDRTGGRVVAEYGETAAGNSMGPDGHTLGGSRHPIVTEVIENGEMVSIDDLADTDEYRAGNTHRVHAVEVDGARSCLGVPLFAGGRAIGGIGLERREVRPYTESDIALAETFAAQAVIAIENVRQFRELQTQLEREEASREILGAISESRENERPVFDVILENACRLCKAPLAYLSMVTEDRTHVVSPARRGAFEKFGAQLDRLRVPLAESRLALARAIAECRVFRLDDIADDDVYRSGDPNRVSMVEDEGARSLLVVPLVSGGLGIGSITLYRREVSPFSDDDVALVETFAAQAVIAIENVRQFRELQTRLEREAASREILNVISRSRDDERPVFDVILKNAANLCHAPLATLTMVNEERTHLEYVTHWGTPLQIFSSGKDRWALDLDREITRAVIEKRIIHAEDIADSDLYRQGDRVRRLLVDVEGIRTLLVVPLVSGDKAIGNVILHRYEVRGFSVDEIALVETFAAQAVIAIENVRQFRAVIEARDDAEAALANLKKAQERLVQAEKMASLGQLTAGIAHEIKNPLNFVNNFAKLSGDLLVELGEILEEPIAALGEEDREDAEDLFRTVRENLDKINQHGRRADGIVKNMLLHSREGPSQRQSAKVNSIAAEALNLAYHGARAENPSFNIDMKTDLAEDVGVIECYPQDLMRVFLNVISNGMYAAYQRRLEEDGSAPEITVSSRRDGDRVEVEVRDNGNGIPPEVREKIFTPFFTTKPAGEGTGLGLSLSYDIVVKQHGGDLTVESEPGQFTVFTVSLPRLLPAENAEAS